MIMPVIVSIDKNNNCKIIIDNCAPYDVTIDCNDILGIESHNLIPLEDSTISAILSDINKHLPKVPKKKLTKAEIAEKAHLNVPSVQTMICGHFIQTPKCHKCK
jgi:hypothetical protein